MSLIYDALARSQQAKPAGPQPAGLPPPAPDLFVSPGEAPGLPAAPSPEAATDLALPPRGAAGERERDPALATTPTAPALHPWLLPGAIVLAAVVIGGGLVYGRRESRVAAVAPATATIPAVAPAGDESISDLLDDRATLSAATDAPVLDDGADDTATGATPPAGAGPTATAGNDDPLPASAAMNDRPPPDSPVTRAAAEVQATTPARPARVIELDTGAEPQAPPPARSARAPTQGSESAATRPSRASRAATSPDDVATTGSEPEQAPLDPVRVQEAIAAADREGDGDTLALAPAPAPLLVPAPAARPGPPAPRTVPGTPPRAPAVAVVAPRPAPASAPPAVGRVPTGAPPAMARVPASKIPGFQVHSYDDTGARRFIIVSGARVREGDYLPDGGRITSITPDGVVLQRGADKTFVETPR